MDGSGKELPIVFPCDLPDWRRIAVLLGEVRHCDGNALAAIGKLQEAYELIHCSYITLQSPGAGAEAANQAGDTTQCVKRRDGGSRSVQDVVQVSMSCGNKSTEHAECSHVASSGHSQAGPPPPPDNNSDPLRSWTTTTQAETASSTTPPRQTNVASKSSSLSGAGDQRQQENAAAAIPKVKKNVFAGLQKFAFKELREQEREKFFEVVLPFIVDRAVEIEELRPRDRQLLCLRQQAKRIVLTRRFVSSVVACSFLCLFPGRPSSRESSFNAINFDDFFAHCSNPAQCAKLKCVLHYFEQLCAQPDGPAGYMSLTRQVMPADLCPGLEDWMFCDAPLCDFRATPEGLMEDAGPECIQVDFANRKIGGAVLHSGRVQEEIRFSTAPELLASMLYMEAMDDNEAIVVRGYQTFSATTGYARTLEYVGDYMDEAKVDDRGFLQNTMVAMDALPCGKIGGAAKQYKDKHVLRELNKALVGLQQRPPVVQHSDTTPRAKRVRHSLDREGSPTMSHEYYSTAGHQCEQDAMSLNDYTSSASTHIPKGAMANSKELPSSQAAQPFCGDVFGNLGRMLDNSHQVKESGVAPAGTAVACACAREVSPWQQEEAEPMLAVSENAVNGGGVVEQYAERLIGGLFQEGFQVAATATQASATNKRSTARHTSSAQKLLHSNSSRSLDRKSEPNVLSSIDGNGSCITAGRENGAALHSGSDSDLGGTTCTCLHSLGEVPLDSGVPVTDSRSQSSWVRSSSGYTSRVEITEETMEGVRSGSVDLLETPVAASGASQQTITMVPEQSSQNVTSDVAADHAVPGDDANGGQRSNHTSSSHVEEDNARPATQPAPPVGIDNPRIVQYVENLVNSVCKDSREVVMAHYNNVENAQVQAAGQLVDQLFQGITEDAIKSAVSRMEGRDSAAVEQGAAAADDDDADLPLDIQHRLERAEEEGVGFVNGAVEGREAQSNVSMRQAASEPSSSSSSSSAAAAAEVTKAAKVPKRPNVTAHPLVDFRSEIEKDYSFQVARVSSGLLNSIENFVDRMIQESFDSLKQILESSDQASRSRPLSTEERQQVEDYVSDMVDNTFEAAYDSIREHEYRRCHVARHGLTFGLQAGGGGRVLDRELTSYAEDFVMNVIEEALFIFRTQYVNRSARNSRKASFEFPWVKIDSDLELYQPRSRSNTGASSQTDDSDSHYFQAEFGSEGHRPRAVDHRVRRGSCGYTSRSCQYLRAAHSNSQLNRRRSYDETRMARRRSSGFKDVMLSNFEDELNRSEISSPSLHMFESDFELNGRRASEPASHGPLRKSAEFLFAETGDKKRACSVDSTASRVLILDWLVRRPSSSSGHSSGSRKRNSSHLDWFAQDLLVEAFNDAFVELFGENYEELSQVNASVDGATCAGGGIPEKISQMSESLSSRIMDEAYRIIHQRMEQQNNHEFCEARDAAYSEMEYVADLFAKKIMREALEIIKTEWQDASRRPVATGNWGCGAYRGDPQLKSLLQWAAASRGGAPVLHYYTFGNDRLLQLESLTRSIVAKRWTVGELMQRVVRYCRTRCEDGISVTLFDYLADAAH